MDRTAINNVAKKIFYDYRNTNISLKNKKNKADKTLLEVEMSENPYTIFDFEAKFRFNLATIKLISYFDEIIPGMSDNNYGKSPVFAETKNAVKRF